MRRAAAGAWLGGVAILVATRGAPAQQRPQRPVVQTAQPTASTATPSANGSTGAMRARFGTEAATRLLRSADADERLRGLERAAATHTPEGLILLQRAASPGAPGGFDPRAPIDGVARRDPRALLVAVRGLASWAERETARSALAGLLSAPAQSFDTRVSSAPTRDGAADEAEGAARILLARQEAALALAQSGGQLALEALIAIARSGGPGQSAALDALAVYPPAFPVLGGVTLTTPATIALATQLGDLRALDPIEGALRASDPALRAAAIAALGVAGDVREMAALRTSVHDGDARVRVAAGSSLVRLGAPDAGQVVEALIADDLTALAALRIALDIQSEGVTKAAAARALASADPELRAAAVAVLGRQTHPSAVGALAQLANDRMLAGDAAYALARSPSPSAMAALGALAAAPATRRLAARAYFVRRFVRGERDTRLDGLLAGLAAAAEPRDRAVGLQALVALGERPLAAALADADPRVRRAAAMGALPRWNAREAADVLSRLATETDGPTRDVLAMGLLEPDAAARVPTMALVDRAESGGSDAPLAALALARRADDEHAAELDALLASRDPLIRAHAALGLGEGAARDATGRLARAYAWEAAVGVRRAILVALARRDGDTAAPTRRETLAWAAALDPDRVARWTAARALAGDRTPRRSYVSEVAWLRVVPGEGATLPGAITAALVGSDGIALPIAFDDDGYALVPGIPPGEARVRLAPRVPPYEAPTP